MCGSMMSDKFKSSFLPGVTAYCFKGKWFNC